LVAFWHAQVVKNRENAYDVIFEPIIKSLKLQESDEGVDVPINGNTVKVRAAFVHFSADNLGYHSLFGFLESFSANKFCRFCKATKDDTSKYFSETDFQKRTVASYNEAISKSLHPGFNASEAGIRANCVLNKLGYFHVIENFAVDAMHDLLRRCNTKRASRHFDFIVMQGILLSGGVQLVVGI
jgi:hypothetical protein